MPITEDVRKAGEAFVFQSRAALEEARKPLYAVLGAGDLAVSRATSQLRELPAETDARMKHVRTRIEDLRADVVSRLGELRQHANSAPSLAQSPAELRSRVETYVNKAIEVYADLARRGEEIATRLQSRGAHEVASAAGKVEEAADKVGDTAGDVEESAAKTAATRRRSATARKAAATRAGKTSAAK